MMIKHGLTALSVWALAGAFTAQAAMTVKASNLHICCNKCEKALTAATKLIAGVKASIDGEAGTVTLEASSLAAAQKAVDAMAKAGYHGKTDNAKVAFKEDSGAKDAKVKQATLTGTHRCCSNCVKAMKKAIASVAGVKGSKVSKGTRPVRVTGDFNAAALVKAINAAGFHVKVK
jgi:mercuric ion binding protein